MSTTFESDKKLLQDLLQSIMKGEIQLPDFQRGWIWDDDHIKSLLASVSQSYPIGAIMMLQTGNPKVNFKPRLVEGLKPDNYPRPEFLILDGQQRLTALFQSLKVEKAVITKTTHGKRIQRWYYIDMHKALNPSEDREEAIVGVPEDHKVRNFRNEVTEDYSTPEKEYQAGKFPLSKVFDCSGWRFEYNKFWSFDQGKTKHFDEFEKEIIKRFEQYQLPVIRLYKETPKDAVCQVFEKVNTGGVSLTVFELLTATYAAENFNLREDWKVHAKNLKKFTVLKNTGNTDFLQTITLLATYNKRKKRIEEGIEAEKAPGISCKRKEILKLSLDEYKEWTNDVTEGFKKAAKLLSTQKLFAARDLPYRTQVTPLAAILAILKNAADNWGVQKKVSQWYWCGVFGELYGGAIESRFAKDLPEVLNWIKDGSEPSSIRDANFVPTRLLTLRTRNSAAYKGLYALLLRDGVKDFLSGEDIDLQRYFDDKIEIHHIFPKEWCRKNKIDTKNCDSIINKTPLSARTNRMIGSKPPSTYLARIQNKTNIDDRKMDQILLTHLIDPTSFRSDDFDTFFKTRQEALLNRIEKAMGKPILREEA